MTGLLFKAIGVWLILVLIAVVNAAIREKLLAPTFGTGIALPLSGLLLSVWIFLVAFAATPFFGDCESRRYVSIGVVWFGLTLSFEMVLGYFVAGKPWREILQVFNVMQGDLFVVALLATLISPWLSAKLRSFRKLK